MSAAMDARDLWESDWLLRDRLDDAGWRYAALTGLVGWMDDDFWAAVHEADQMTYAHLARSYGTTLLDIEEATTFVCDLVGCDREVASAWLDYDWGKVERAKPSRSTPPIDMLRCAPIALCCGCMRVFPKPPLGGRGDLKSPCCQCDACDCEDCIDAIAALMMGDWRNAGLNRPRLVVSWHADHGVRMRGQAP